ncbi:MAG TPA: hypothetical protein VGF32_09025, partial [Streptosporangiaceae bacterium]
TVADLARELLKLSDSQLQTLRSLATAASEPAVAAMLSRLAAGRLAAGRQAAGRRRRSPL